MDTEKMDTIRIGCEFESILDVPAFDMIVPNGTSEDEVLKLYSPETFQTEIEAARDKLDRAESGKEVEKDALDNATLDYEYLRKQQGPNARKFASLLDMSLKGIPMNEDYLQLEKMIKAPGVSENDKKVFRKAQKSIVRRIVDKIPIPKHDRSSYAKRINDLLAIIKTAEDLDTEYVKRNVAWGDEEREEFDEKYAAADKKRDAAVRMLKYMDKYEIIIVVAWLKRKWTSYKKSHEIGMIDEFSGFEKRSGFENWTIVGDDSIRVGNDHRATCFGMEFVGPIMEIKKSDLKSQEQVVGIIGDLFMFLEEMGCNINFPSTTTSTHIHFSPSGTVWDTEKAQKLLCAAYFWDPCVRYLIPSWRRVSNFCLDMRASPGLAEVFNFPDKVFQQEKFLAGRYPRATWEPEDRKVGMFLKCTHKDVEGNMQDIMDKPDKGALRDMFGPGTSGRNAGWNPTNLKMDNASLEAKDTIEWRRGPASLSTADALCWIELIFAFTLAAVEKGTRKELAEIQEPSMEAFQKWLQSSRFEKSLNSPILDGKFEKLRKSQKPLYLYLTPEEEDLLETERRKYQETVPPPPPKSFKVAAPAQKQTPKYTDAFMTDVADKSLAYTPTAWRDQRLKEIINDIRASILSSMSEDLQL